MAVITIETVANRIEELARDVNFMIEAEEQVTLVATRLDEMADELDQPELARLAARLWALL